MPDVPYFHQMGGAAGDDEHGKTQKYPARMQVPAFVDEAEQSDRNRIVGQGDQAVRHDVQPNYDRIPLVTHSMRHEPVGRKNPPEEIHHKLAFKGQSDI